MTFGFIASFATAGVRRLGLAQATVAVAAGLVVVQTIRHSWLPAWETVIQQLPAGGELRNGRLDWPANSPARLAESPFVTVDVDVDQTGSFTHLADFGIELGAQSVKIYSFLGSLKLPYPENEPLALSRASVEPWWGARKPFVLLGIGAGVTLGVMASWIVLTIPGAFAVRLIAFYLDRAVTICGAWKLAAAALLPGAVVMTAAIALYGLQRLSLFGLLLALPLHLVLGWIYLLASPMWLPKLSEQIGTGKNPFAGGSGKRTAAPRIPTSPETKTPR
ncbi:MAG: hypothetical protein HY043_18885 [Verrucomicrobia bacterium]|nr:hypothetical protein [Verrucomicrobiota bacterium]